MGKLPDIDIDFSNRDKILDIIKHNPASLSDGKKHNTGVYVTDIPMNPITNSSTIDFKQAEDRGYFKLDFLNVNVYSGIKDEEHLNKLMSKEPNWYRLWEDQKFCDQVIHVNGHHNLMVKLKPDTMTFVVEYSGDMDTSNNGLWPSISGSVQSSNNVALYITIN